MGRAGEVQDVSHAIWGIIYDLPEQGRDDYLAWFHDVHMGEKLARPGYVWAAHYEVVDAKGNHITSLGTTHEGDRGHGYIALFGGADTQVFLDPSPAQIKPRQTPLTREMMGKRIGQRSFIAAVEWSAQGDQQGDENEQAPAHPVIHLDCCDAPGGDEALGAWCVQVLKPAIHQQPAFRRISKLLAATGPMKHVILAEFDSVAQTPNASPPVTVTHLSGSPFAARRIAPPLSQTE